jgi:pyruvate/2-oxoglutarate dehydrogenase complex dihydrolipoamide dehydrogenase (E3) component
MVECLGARDAPAHFMALGGDERSVALALGLRRLGLGSILQAADGLLPGYDPELVAPLRRTLLELGVTLLEGKPGHGERPAPSPDLIYVPAAAAALADLDCDAAGVELRGGALQLSPALRTTNPRVYAIGGVAGARSSQAAQAQVGVVLRSAFFRIPASYEAAQVPLCVETCPGLAAVGLDEPAARLLGPITTWRWPLAETPDGAARGLAHGFVKVVADRRGVILGAGVVGPEAAEQIGLWTMALRARLTLSDVATLPLPSPSLAEASRRAASQYLAHRLRSPWTKRALSLLTWLG